jgi:hypothetical protein
MRTIAHPTLRRRPAQMLLVLLLAIGVSLVVAKAAFAAYWFYQGNLPMSDGTRTALLGSNPSPPIYQRESWSSCTHNMYYVQIENGGSWDVGTFYYSNGCDQEIMVQYPDLHDNYGCENPPGDSTVYVNCRAGTNP